MTEAVAALSTRDLKSIGPLYILGDAVLVDGLGEGGPGGGMFKLGAAGEQLVPARDAYIDPVLEVILINLPTKERAERHRVVSRNRVILTLAGHHCSLLEYSGCLQLV